MARCIAKGEGMREIVRMMNIRTTFRFAPQETEETQTCRMRCAIDAQVWSRSTLSTRTVAERRNDVLVELREGSQDVRFYRCGKAVPSRTNGHGKDVQRRRAKALASIPLRCTLRIVHIGTYPRFEYFAISAEQLFFQFIINCIYFHRRYDRKANILLCSLVIAKNWQNKRYLMQ